MAMLEIRNAPFDGAKAVWVPNAETGYMKVFFFGFWDFRKNFDEILEF